LQTVGTANVCPHDHNIIIDYMEYGMSMNVNENEWMNEWMDGWMDGWMDE